MVTAPKGKIPRNASATKKNEPSSISLLAKKRLRQEIMRPSFQVVSLPNQIHEVLEDAIIHGDIEPGTRVRADDIADEFGISRIPVREALSSLHEAGWVDIRPRYGVYVKARSRNELMQLFEARAGLDSEISMLASQRRDEEDIATLKRIVERARSSAELEDVEALYKASNDFYVALRNAAGNNVLATISLNLEKRARFYFYPIAKQLGRDWAVRQAELVDLIIAGEGTLAAAATRRHMQTTGSDVLRLLDLLDSPEEIG
jgi:DNA-binding GntR family transcriptional regulator